MWLNDILQEQIVWSNRSNGNPQYWRSETRQIESIILIGKRFPNSSAKHFPSPLAEIFMKL